MQVIQPPPLGGFFVPEGKVACMDIENETETVRQYRERVRQCELLGEFAMAEHIREILKDEQEHQIDLATALGVDVPDMTG